MQQLYPHELREIPKVELHRHLDCSMRWSTMIELAPHVGVPLAPNFHQQREQFLVSQPMKDLESVLKKFLNAQKLLASEEILTRLAFEACEDAYNDGILILELRYAPTFINDGHHNLSFEKIHQALLKGVALAEKKYPIAVGLICIIQRIKSFEIAKNVCDFAIDNKNSFIALDLADNEDGFEVNKFAPLFQKAKNSGLHITIHSGEIPHPQSAKWIQNSVELLGAERIGHGVQVIQDTNVMNFLKDKKIPLEVCPISNWLTQAFSTHQQHPVRKLIDSGVLVTINSDDPGIFGTTLTDDYQVLHQAHHFSVQDFNKANDIAATHSFIPLEKKQKVWPRAITKK